MKWPWRRRTRTSEERASKAIQGLRQQQASFSKPVSHNDSTGSGGMPPGGEFAAGGTP